MHFEVSDSMRSDTGSNFSVSNSIQALIQTRANSESIRWTVEYCAVGNDLLHSHLESPLVHLRVLATTILYYGS
jgi:hypothetical protein